MDREEFFRLKKVKGIKEKAAAAEDAEHNKKNGRSSDIDNEYDGQPTKDLLGDEDDNDVIF